MDEDDGEPICPPLKNGGARLPGKSHGVGATQQKYALLDPGGEAP